MSNLTDRYNRNRPFLMITRSAHVAKDVRTEYAGWSKVSDNTNVVEKHRIIDRVNDSHLRDAIVIIDVVKNVCVKNSLKDTPDNEVISYFLQKYKEEVAESLNSWALIKARERAELDAKTPKTEAVDGVYGA